MPRFITYAFILDKYGPRLDKHAIAKVLGLAPGTVMNHVTRGTLGLPTYVDHGKLWADAEHIAEYLDKQAVRAKQASSS